MIIYSYNIYNNYAFCVEAPSAIRATKYNQIVLENINKNDDFYFSWQPNRYEYTYDCVQIYRIQIPIIALVKCTSECAIESPDGTSLSRAVTSIFRRVTARKKSSARAQFMNEWPRTRSDRVGRGYYVARSRAYARDMSRGRASAARATRDLSARDTPDHRSGPRRDHARL